MSAYVLVQVETNDPEAMARYRELAAPTVMAHGGRYLARGGATECLEGDWHPSRVVVLEFPDVETARGWWSCPGYAEAKTMRQAAGETNMLLIEGMPEQ
ncbi:MAG: DUF1330 domain-containing protein [Chloroflexi bacterium]|nr:DUF1330 domain-containing protein [Chloroflexota bacterium]